MPPPRPAHLAPSELGTKEYWDSLYATELANHASNPEDKGTVWFDDADAESKMVQFLADLDSEGSLNVRSVLDLGCGNGSLLRAVRDELWPGGVEAEDGESDGDGDGDSDGGSGEPRERKRKRKRESIRLLGVDYSEASVLLAKSIKDDDNDNDNPAVPISFSVWDMLEGSASDLVADPASTTADGACWDLILDKGTFDAISLGNSNTDGTDNSVEVRYRAQVLNLLRPGGRFLITSCNWTETELCAWMVQEEDDVEGARLEKVGRVAYPSFQFGGVQGQTVCTVCFEKRTRP